MALSPEKLDMFRQLYDESVAHNGEISGLVYYTNGVWRLASVHYGNTDTVRVPDHVDLEEFSQAKVVRYHTHIPHGGQICMPPSSADWTALSRKEKALVVAREGVYKFYGTTDLQLAHHADVDEMLRLVHIGQESMASYHQFVTGKGMRFEFYSFAGV